MYYNIGIFFKFRMRMHAKHADRIYRYKLSLNIVCLWRTVLRIFYMTERVSSTVEYHEIPLQVVPAGNRFL
jgi:hypothetical protein